MRASLLWLWLLVACGQTTGPVVAVRLLAPDGQGPLDGVERAELTVTEAGAAPTRLELSVGEAGIDLAVPLLSESSVVELSVLLTGPALHRVGRTPPFRVAETGGALNVLVGEPGRCVPLARPELVPPRAGAAVAGSGTFAWAVGGQQRDRWTGTVEVIDLLRLARGPVAELDPAPEVPAIVATSTGIVVLSRTGATWLDLRRGNQALPVHAEATLGAGLVALGSDQVAVVGGGLGTPSARVSIISGPADVRALELAVAREAPLVAAVGQGAALVVGGGGGAAVELLRSDGSHAVLDWEPRTQLLLALGHPASGQALLLGADGHTEHVVGCPDDCRVQPGPAWPNPRQDPGVAPLPDGYLLVGGGAAEAASDATERVRFVGSAVQIEAQAPLVHPRKGAAVVHLAGGVGLVLSGRDAGGIRDDSEVCFPSVADVR